MSLLIKHRPKTWDELIGNDALVNSLRNALQQGSSHAFLFSGPSGCGKTTIARLAAWELKVEDQNIIEIDAATNNGVDDMRQLIELLHYKPLSGTNKVVIVDECQAITAQAWKALLKSIEEPPEGVYWFFCTTELAKVPVSIKNRCLSYQVRPLTYHQLNGLLTTINTLENKLVDKGILHLCVVEAEGSPRRAIGYLAQMSHETDKDEAHELIRQEKQEPENIIVFARYLVERVSWTRMRPVLQQLQYENPETVRRVVEAYILKVILTNEDEHVTRGMVFLLDLFKEPVYGTSMAPIVLAAAQWTLQMVPAIDKVR